ncbi:hypothetical protein PEC18_18825 [Paucibacter sp. O1-1]|nr:hypothetical protein [Paucibacter sp. O1-1]MCU7372856.1 hypothetical protein [Paucibacter sp. O1-1]MDA3826559.1 hypothetical protein [Paucibacter sp. O1-1]MDA3827852.1 hypothetical protein [Paucibacter sp. O1-1]
MTDSELATKAQGIARNLTYNDDTPQAQAKHMLLELSHRLDARNVRMKDWMLWDARGRGRFATWRELLAYWIAGTLPREL